MKSPYSIAPAAPYNTLLASLNPLVWWKLDDAPGSTTAADSSGNGHNATATNVTFGSAGPVAGGTAASFNGTSSTLTSSYVLPALDQITAMVWYYVSAWPSGFNPRYVTNNHADGTPYVGFELFLNDSTQVPGQSPMFCVGDGATSSQQTGLANSGTAGQWHMMVGTYDGKTVSVYQDGQLLASSSFSGQIATSTFGVGGGFGVSYNGDYVSGLAAQAAVLDYAVGPGVPARLYKCANVTGRGPLSASSGNYNLAAVPA